MRLRYPDAMPNSEGLTWAATEPGRSARFTPERQSRCTGNRWKVTEEGGSAITADRMPEGSCSRGQVGLWLALVQTP